jgi:adenylosuccinate lyase
MPHKRNPVGSENLSGLARVLRANALSSLENIALWHERDISHSSVERITIPDSSLLADYMLDRLTTILDGLQVYPERMKQNIAASYGLYNSQRVMLALTEKGLSRESAYAIVQKNAMKSWKEKKEFRKLLLVDKEVRRYLTPKIMDKLFSLNHYFRNVDYIFRRVFRRRRKGLL